MPANHAFGPEFQANTYTFVKDIGFPVDFGTTVTSSSPGSPKRMSQDGTYFGIFAQRFSLPPLAILDIDGNGLIEPAHRRTAGLRPASGSPAPRSPTAQSAPTAPAAPQATSTAYINGIGLTLDIDDSGTLEPLADGLLVLRFMFGFTGTSLTNGAVAVGSCTTAATRRRSLPYLQTLD